MIAIRACAALAAFLLAAPALGADFYVDPVLGNDANTGTSPGAAWRTIFRAAQVLGQSDDTIHLAPGLYSAASGEVFPILLGGQHVRGDQGAAVTIVEGGPVILQTWQGHPHFAPSWVRELRGVTLRGATSAAIECSVQPVLVAACTIENSAVGISTVAAGWDHFAYDLRIDDVTVRNCGTGMWIRPGAAQSQVTVSGSRITHSAGAGVRATSAGVTTVDLALDETIVAHNAGDGLWLDGGSVSGARIDVASCLIARNGGAGLRLEGLGPFVHVVASSTTVAHNTGTGVRIQAPSDSDFGLDGVISHGNGLEYQDALGQFATVVASHCDIPGAPFVGTNGNIAADPLFVAPLADDFRLRFASPCVDTGNPAGPAAPELGPYPPPIDGDLDTQERPDMGAFEFAPMDLVTTGALGSPLQIHLWGAAGGTTTVYASRMAPVPPSSTPFGQLDLNPASSFVLFTSAVAPGPPVVFGRPIPNNPLLLGRTFSFQALTTSASAPLGAAWTNVASVTITP